MFNFLCTVLLFVLGGKIGFFWMEYQSAQYKLQRLQTCVVADFETLLYQPRKQYI